jgi:predicted hotdog family 3-hydroxylacyl-ACP dehydratase
MIIDKNEILNYIPQRPPFVMIDVLEKADENEFHSTFELKESNLFNFNGIISESCLVENIAQTCAAGFGYVARQKNGEETRLGFIGAVTKLNVYKLPKINSQIVTKISVLNQFENIHLVEGISYLNGEKLIDCQLKIVLS